MASLTERLYARTTRGKKEDEDERKIKAGIVSAPGYRVVANKKNESSVPSEKKETDSKTTPEKKSLTERLYARTTKGQTGETNTPRMIISNSPAYTRGSRESARQSFYVPTRDFTSQEEYDSWRSSIRSSEEIKAEMEEVNKALKDNKWAQWGLAYGGNGEAWHEKEKEQAELREKYKLLSEELEYSNYFAYGDLSKNADFAQKSVAGESQLGTNLWQRLQDSDIEKAYEYINNIGGYRDNLVAAGEAAGTSATPQFDAYNYMNEEQKATFNYIYHTQGGEAAQKYLDYITDSPLLGEGALNYQHGQEIAEGLNTDFQRAAYGLRAGIDQFSTGMGEVFGKGTAPTSAIQYAGQAAKDELGKVGQFIYDAGAVTGNMLPSILLSTATAGFGAPTAVAGLVGSATLGASAGGNAYNQAMKEGWAPSEAKSYGALVGASEATLQYVLGGIGKLGGTATTKVLTKVSAIDNALARIAATGAVKIGGEVTEELLQEFLEPAIRSIIHDEKYDSPEAKDLIYTALLTALTTGLMEGGGIASAAQNKSVTPGITEYGKGMDFNKADEETVKALIEEGLASEENTASHQLALDLQKRQEAGKKISGHKLGTLYQANEEAIAAEEQARREREGTPEEQAASRATGYGKHGSKLFVELVQEKGMDMETAQKAMQVAYEQGLTNSLGYAAKDIKDITQQRAYKAGQQDAILDLAERQKKAPTIRTDAGFDMEGAPSDLTNEDRAFMELMAKAYAVKGTWGESTESESFDGKIDGNGLVTLSRDLGISEAKLREIGGPAHLRKIANIAQERKKSFIGVVAHEINLHRMMELAPEEGLAFVNAMYAHQSKNRPDSIGTLAQAKRESYMGSINISLAMEEISADTIVDMYGGMKNYREAMERILTGNDEKAKSGARTFIELLKDTVARLKRVLARLTGKANVQARDEVRTAIRENEKLIQLFEEAQKAALRNVAKAQQKTAQSAKNEAQVKAEAASMKDGVLTRTTDADGTTVLTTANGNPVAQMDENGSALFSLKTYDSFGRAELKRWLDLRVSKNQLDKNDAADIVRQLDEYYEMCQQFKKKYAPFGAWSDASVITDDKGKPVFSVVKANGEYAMNLDFSLVCKKRRTLDAVFREMIRRGIMNNVDLEEADIAKINDIIRESGFETACALCFVDSKRYRQAKVADTFVTQYNDMVKMLLPEGGDVKVHYFDFVETGHYKNAGTGLHTLSNAQLRDGIEKLKQVMRENGSKTVPYKIAKHLMENPQDRRYVNRGEFMNTDGFENLKVKNPDVLKLYNSSKGSGGPKAALSDVQYLGEILKKNNFTPARAYAVGGVRIQSFSDYIPRLVFDYLQMVADLSAKKLPAHAYTKEAIFVKQFGMTGIKMNMSLVPAVAEDGVAAGLDKDGNYFWFDGQSFGSDVGVKGSGQTGFELAIQIQNTPGYSQHCGTIAVGVSKEHIEKMLDDENIRMIIPYHKSSLNHIVAVMNNIDKYTDYTNVQNTRFKDTGKKIDKKDFNFNEALRRTGDAKTAANEYLAWCEKNGYIPKFDEFADHENYYKVLEDFSTYDNGEAAPQGAVTMTFPKEGDAFGSMAELIEQGLDEDAVLEGRREKNLSSIVDKVESVLKKRVDTRYSRKDSDGNTLSSEQVEYFKDSKVRDENGNLVTVYHSSPTAGFTVFNGELGKGDYRFSEYGTGITFFTDNKEMAASYSNGEGGQYEGYLNITKPYVVDAKGRAWDRVTSEFSQGLYEEMRDAFTKEEKAALVSLAGWEDFSLFNQEVSKAVRDSGKPTADKTTKALNSAFWKCADMAALFNMASDNFSDDAIRRNSYMDMTTNQIVEKALKDGSYDGVIIKNVIDYGGDDFYTSMSPTGTDYIIFNSNQFKAKDNKNPTRDPDIRYSQKSDSFIDDDILLDDESLDELLGTGWITKLGYEVSESKSRYKGDTTAKGKVARLTGERIERLFREYGASMPKYAQAYITAIHPRDFLSLTLSDETYRKWDAAAEAGTDSELYPLDVERLTKETQTPYLNVDTETGEVVGHEGRHRMRALLEAGVTEVPIAVIDYNTKYSKQKEASLSLTPQNFRGVDKDFTAEVKNLIPINAVYRDEIVEAYGGEGDIRFSQKEQSDLLKENEKLKEVNEALKAQFKLTKFATVDKKSLEAFTKQLLKDYQSGADINETRDALNELYTYIANGEEGHAPSWDAAYRMAYDAATNILQNVSILNDEMYQMYSELRHTIRNTGITLSKEDEHDLMGYENLNEFRKANFGRIKLVKDGLSVDSFYQELATSYPEFFDGYEHTHPGDQLSHIAEVLDSLQPFEENPHRRNMRESATWLANDIMDRFFDLPQAKPTFADKAERKLTEQKIKDGHKLEKLREEKNERIKSILKAERKKAAERVAKERADKQNKVKALKQKQRAKEAKMSENRKANVLRERIMRHVGQLHHKLTRPTDKQHIPQELQTAVTEMLYAINLESKFEYAYGKDGMYHRVERGTVPFAEPTKRTQAFVKVREQYEKILADESSDMVVDPALLGNDQFGVRSLLNEVIAMSDTPIDAMNMKQLQVVWDTVRTIEHSINMAGKTLAMGKYVRRAEFAEAFREGTSTRKPILNSKEVDRRHKDIETPYTFFSRYGEAGHDFYRMLRNAQDNEQRMIDEIAFRMQSIVSSEKRDKLQREAKTFTTQLGEEVTLSKAHCMEIYLLYNREQAKQHLLGGGIVQPEIKHLKVKRGPEPIRLNELDIGNIISFLGDEGSEERKIADKLQKLTLLLAEWGNEASMTAYGYEKFGDPHYWTIRSADEQVNQTVEKNRNNVRSIANMGSAKPLDPKANNALDISSAFETFDRHAKDMVTYSAWLCIMEDANALFNFKFKDEKGNPTGKNMQTLLNKYGGASSTSYWLELMKDIQNGIKSPSDTGHERIFTKAVGKIKKASVSGNIRVVAQQPTAYARAAAVIGVDSMLVALGKDFAVKPALNGWKKAVKYAPIAARKAAGGYEIASNLAQLEEFLYKPETKLGKFVQGAEDAPLWAAGMADQVTWGTIWNACEHEIHKRNKKLDKNSDEFITAVKELFTEVIDQTQVVDGVLQRSQAMRSGSALMQQATSFTGEPTMAANMVIRAYDKVRHETDPQKRKLAIKGLGVAVGVYSFTAIINAFAQSLVDGLRDDDEEKDYWQKVWKHFVGISGDEEKWYDYARNIVLAGNVTNNFNPMTWLPYWKDILSLLQGYSVERMDAASISDFLDSVGKVIKSFSGEGKLTPGYAVMKSFTYAAKLSGSSAYNILRDVEGILHTFQVETDNLEALYETERLMTRSVNNKTVYLNLLYRAKESDSKLYWKIYNDLIADGFTKEEIDAGLENQAMKAGLEILGFKTQKAAYDAMYQKLLNGDKNAYYDMVDTLVEHGASRKSIESAMRSRAEDAGFSVSDLQRMGAAGAIFAPTYEVEGEKKDTFSVDNLSDSQYERYSASYGKMVDSLMDEMGNFAEFDHELANNLLNDIYDYAEKVSLAEVAGGEFVEVEEDGTTKTYLQVGGKRYSLSKWIYDIQSEGLPAADYILFKCGTADAETTLEKLAFMDDMNLTEAEENAILSHSVFTAERYSQALGKDQYDDFADGYASVMDIAMDALLGNSNYGSYDEKAQDKMMGHAETFATEYAFGEINGDFKTYEWVDDAVAAYSAGVDLGTIFELKYVHSQCKGVQKADGSTVRGSVKDEFFRKMDEYGLSYAQKQAIWKVMS